MAFKGGGDCRVSLGTRQQLINANKEMSSYVAIMVLFSCVV